MVSPRSTCRRHGHAGRGAHPRGRARMGAAAGAPTEPRRLLSCLIPEFEGLALPRCQGSETARPLRVLMRRRRGEAGA